MEIKFKKMNGAGNDFIMVDNRDGSIRLTREQIAWICDRHRGVGGDGLLLVEPAKKMREVDFRMRYYNADGGEVEMCGNGARCFARFVQNLGWKKDRLRFITPAGIIRATYEGEWVKINLSPPQDLNLDRNIHLSSGKQTIHTINTGVPHVILFVEDADRAMVQPLGSEIRYHRMFQPKGTNVNFVQLKENNSIWVRTYERGVENETLACGTGVVASAIVSHFVHRLQPPVRVKVQGGETLEVDFSTGGGSASGGKTRGSEVTDVFLKGPAVFAFEGKLTLPKKI